MAAPLVTGTLCTPGAVSSVSFTANLPAWNPGDLCLVLAAAGASGTMTLPNGWTTAIRTTASLRTTYVVWRIMQAGDSNPQFSMPATTFWVGLAHTIQAGTFDPAQPIDAPAGFGTWDFQSGTTVVDSASVSTNTDDALAIGIGLALRSASMTLLTGGWTALVSGCNADPANLQPAGATAGKPMPIAGASGIAQWELDTARTAWGSALAIKPSATPAGITVNVPLDTVALTAHVPTVETVTQVNVPEHTAMITAFPPVIAIGTIIRVPLNQANVNAFAPVITVTTDEVNVPLHVATLTPYLPQIRTGHRVDVPIFNAGITAFVPAVGVGTLISVPSMTLNVSVRVPTVGTGARTDVPIAVLAVTERAPTVSATPGAFINVPLNQAAINPYAPVIDTVVPELLATIESDADRLSFMIDQPATLSYAGVSYVVVSAEVDGEELDTGRTLDGWIEVQMLTSESVAIPEHATVRLDGQDRIVHKIDDLGGGMSVLYVS